MPNWLRKLRVFLLPRYRWSIFVSILLVGAVFLFCNHIAYATVGETINKILVNVSLPLISLVGKLLSFVTGALIAVCKYNNFINASPVNTGWIVCRDICNMFFVLILLYNAFSLVIGGFTKGKSDIKSTIIPVIIAAIVVNFSKLICGLIIDVAQVFMMIFVSAFKDSIAANFFTGLQLEKIVGFANDFEQKSADDPGFGQLFVACILALIFLIIALVVVSIMFIILLLRIIYLWFLIILSPLAFTAQAIPAKSIQGFNGIWWKKFSSQVIVGPLMAFFLWLSLSIISTTADLRSNLKDSQGNSISISGSSSIVSSDTAASVARANDDQAVAITEIGKWDNIMSFVIAIILLVLSLTQAQSLGVAGGAIAGKWAEKISEKPQKWGKAIADTSQAWYKRNIDVGGRTKAGVAKGTSFLGQKAGISKIPGVGGYFSGKIGQVQAWGEKQRRTREGLISKVQPWANMTTSDLRKVNTETLNNRDGAAYAAEMIKRGEFKKTGVEVQSSLLMKMKHAEDKLLVPKDTFKNSISAMGRNAILEFAKAENIDKNKLNTFDIVDLNSAIKSKGLSQEVSDETAFKFYRATLDAKTQGKASETADIDFLKDISPKQRKSFLSRPDLLKDLGKSKLTPKGTDGEEGKDWVHIFNEKVFANLADSANKSNQLNELSPERRKDYYKISTNQFLGGELNFGEFMSRFKNMDDNHKVEYFTNIKSYLPEFAINKEQGEAFLQLLGSLNKENLTKNIYNMPDMQEALKFVHEKSLSGEASPDLLARTISGLNSHELSKLDLSSLGIKLNKKEHEQEIIKKLDPNGANNIQSSDPEVMRYSANAFNLDMSALNSYSQALNVSKGTAALNAQNGTKVIELFKNAYPEASQNERLAIMDQLKNLLVPNFSLLNDKNFSDEFYKLSQLKDSNGNSLITQEQLNNIIKNAFKRKDKTMLSAEDLDVKLVGQRTNPNSNNDDTVMDEFFNAKRKQPKNFDRLPSEVAEKINNYRKTIGATLFSAQSLNMDRYRATQELMDKYSAQHGEENRYNYEQSPEFNPSMHNSAEVQKYAAESVKDLNLWRARGGELDKASFNNLARGEKITPRVALDFNDPRLANLHLGDAPGATFSGLAKNQQVNDTISQILKENGAGDEVLKNFVSAPNLILLNKGRSGEDIAHVLVHEDLHSQLSSTNQNSLAQIWQSISPEQRTDISNDIKTAWNNRGMSDSEIMNEYFTEGLTNTTRWDRPDGPQLDSATFKALTGMGIKSKYGEFDSEKVNSENYSSAQSSAPTAPESSPISPTTSVASQSEINSTLADHLSRANQNFGSLNNLLSNLDENIGDLNNVINDLRGTLNSNSQLQGPEAENTKALLEKLSTDLADPTRRAEFSSEFKSLINDIYQQNQDNLGDVFKEYLLTNSFNNEVLLNNLNLSYDQKQVYFQQLFEKLSSYLKSNRKLSSEEMARAQQSLQKLSDTLRDNSKQTEFNQLFRALLEQNKSQTNQEST